MKKFIENIRYSKRFILTLIFVLVAPFSFAQGPRMSHPFRVRIDFNKYAVVESLPIDRIMFYFETEIDDENVISLGSGYYMAPVPHKDIMVIRKSSDNSKAIVTRNSYTFGRHYEFNVEESDRRVILWYKDNRIYCGYVYDKKYKVAKYFESKKEFKRFKRTFNFNHINK